MLRVVFICILRVRKGRVEMPRYKADWGIATPEQASRMIDIENARGSLMNAVSWINCNAYEQALERARAAVALLEKATNDVGGMRHEHSKHSMVASCDGIRKKEA